MKIGFIGLGQMGTGMARNLIRAGHHLTVYNRSREKADPMSADGAQVADSAADACQDAEVVFTMLADDRAVEQVIFGDRGVADALKHGSTHISNSTISTSLSRRLTEEHSRRGQGYVSAPVFGRPEAAEGKKLVVIPAGPPELLERFTPLFEAIGRATFVIGAEPWQANAVKLCGNFMIVSMVETYGEAFATLRKAGVEPSAFLEIMNSLFASPVYANYGRFILEDKFMPAGFPLRLGLKDVRLMLQTSEECASPMPMASLVRDQMLAAIANGQSEMDWSSFARTAARNAGLK